jgi:hypothetical protein
MTITQADYDARWPEDLDFHPWYPQVVARGPHHLKAWVGNLEGPSPVFSEVGIYPRALWHQAWWDATEEAERRNSEAKEATP